MNLILEKQDLNEYLHSSAIIDYEDQAVSHCAEGLVKTIEDEALKVKTMYEFVRDQIRHPFDIPFDIQGYTVTCNASEVLKYGQGNCYAKSHLLAALLRYLGIPTGFCYQKLVFSDANPKVILHGLNAVYLRSLAKWIRLDARGNKEGVDAQFSLDTEKLAFPVRPELGETDGEVIYAKPSANVIAALKSSLTLQELEQNLPAEI
ncbi:MAG TPA: transglutaminase family protein [Bacillota bacterium]|nr:transglutaminase family protein [Bacillota bacterium]